MAFTTEELAKHVTLGGLQHFYENIKNIFLKKSEADKTYASIEGNGTKVFNASTLRLTSGDESITIALVPASASTEGMHPTVVLTYQNGEHSFEIPINDGQLATLDDVDAVDTALSNLETVVNKKADTINLNYDDNIAWTLCKQPILMAFNGRVNVDNFEVQPGDVVVTTQNRLTGFYFVNGNNEYSYIGQPSKFSLYFNKADQNLYYINNIGGFTKISFATQQTTGGNGETIEVATEDDIDSIFTQLQNTQNEG